MKRFILHICLLIVYLLVSVFRSPILVSILIWNLSSHQWPRWLEPWVGIVTPFYVFPSSCCHIFQHIPQNVFQTLSLLLGIGSTSSFDVLLKWRVGLVLPLPKLESSPVLSICVSIMSTTSLRTGIYCMCNGSKYFRPFHSCWKLISRNKSITWFPSTLLPPTSE